MIRAGDTVEVRAPEEVLRTLSVEGTLDELPFMPEMLEFCGMRFRVARRAVRTCCYTGSGTHVRSFKTDDVVTLDGVRCSGADHDGCPKACTVFWREAWLRKVDVAKTGTRSSASLAASKAGARGRLKTRSETTYFCQASELINVTKPLTASEKIRKCLTEVRTGNCTGWEMARRVTIWLIWRIRRRVLGEYPRGRARITPTETLSLRPGEWVEVKPRHEILKTVNAQGLNRGLYFSPDMRLLCGTRQRVRTALDRIIVDGSGEMRKMHNTVYLEGSLCSCSHAALGGCARNEFVYWREIWLQRTPPIGGISAEAGKPNSSGAAHDE